jgi:hypothetical protein
LPEKTTGSEPVAMLAPFLAGEPLPVLVDVLRGATH